MLGGGLAAGSLVVLAGAPGTGKTILAQQICFANATPEHRALYYTTWSEPHDKLVRHLEQFEFFDADALGETVDFLHLAGLVSDGSDGLGPIAEEIVRQSIGTSPSVVVIDSSKALHDVVRREDFRRAIYDLASKIAYSNTLLILVGEYDSESTQAEPEFAVADGILQLQNEAHGPVDRRWLRVLKLRGSEPASGQHSFRISTRGFTVFPRLETVLSAELPDLEGRCAFGVDRLDEAIGGGLPRGDSALLLGPSGVGKTLLAVEFIQAGLAKGERCLHISFQETEAQVRAKAASVGHDWGEADGLVVHHVEPVEIDLDEVGALIHRELDAGPVERVVLDSLAELAFAARQTERLPAYVWALSRLIRSAGGTTLFTNEMEALGRTAALGGLSFLFNDVFFLRYVEVESEVRRGLNVLKMRQSAHTNGLLPFEITPTGPVFGEPLAGVSGLLGWGALSGDAERR